MIITYMGAGAVKLQVGDFTLAANPVSKSSALRSSRFGADIVIVSLNHPDMNGAELMEFGDRKPFVITGPGEYEVQDIFIRGLTSKSHYDRKERQNTIYTLTLDGMNICFLGALGEPIPADIKEDLPDIDVLFVPIGGEGVLTAAEAYKVAVAEEPRIVIPVHYDGVGDKNALKAFLKEAGEEKLGAEEKLTIKKKDIEGKEVEVVVLKAQ